MITESINPDSVVIVMAHLEVQHTFERHLPYWRHLGFPVRVMHPSDSPVVTGLPFVPLGPRSHHGPQANANFRLALNWAVRSGYQHFYFFEYDSISLQPYTPEEYRTGLWGNVFANNDPDFRAREFIHPPLCFDLETCREIIHGTMKVDEDGERGFWDRYLGLVAELSGIPMRTYGEAGFSRNTIEIHDEPDFARAVKRGAFMLHGIKTQRVLELALQAMP